MGVVKSHKQKQSPKAKEDAEISLLWDQSLEIFDCNPVAVYTVVDSTGGVMAADEPSNNHLQAVTVDRNRVDSDGDGLTDALEENTCTDPKNADTDGGSMPDGWEVDNCRGECRFWRIN